MTIRHPSADPRYPIISLDDGHVSIIPIGERGNISREEPRPQTIPCGSLLQSSAGNPKPAILVLGEAGSGRTTLLKRFTKWIGTQSNLHWCRIDCDIVDAAQLYRALSEGRPGSWQPGVALFAEFGPYSDSMQGRRVVLLEHLNHYDDKFSNLIATRLRGRFENSDDFELVIVGDSPQIFEQDDAFSTIASIANTYRIPWWSAEQIESSISAYPDADVIAKTCELWTGGQPTLTQMFLERSLASREVKLGRIGARIAEAPPPLVARWQGSLRKLCNDEERMEVARALVRGQSFDRARLPYAAYPLFLAGWMCWNDEKEWHMPECHRRWARRILLEARS